MLDSPRFIVMDVMNSLEVNNGMKPGVVVRYHSTRAEEERVMSGTVVECVVRKDEATIRFQRDDGQECEVRQDGKLYSVGSHFPLNGPVLGIDVNNPSGVNFDDIPC